MKLFITRVCKWFKYKRSNTIMVLKRQWKNHRNWYTIEKFSFYMSLFLILLPWSRVTTHSQQKYLNKGWGFPPKQKMFNLATCLSYFHYYCYYYYHYYTFISFCVPGSLYDVLTSPERKEKIHAWNERKDTILLLYYYQNSCMCMSLYAR